MKSSFFTITFIQGIILFAAVAGGGELFVLHFSLASLPPVLATALPALARCSGLRSAGSPQPPVNKAPAHHVECQSSVGQGRRQLRSLSWCIGLEYIEKQPRQKVAIVIFKVLNRRKRTF